jgi:hypothetical protein
MEEKPIKIPDFILLKESRKELGMLKSEIEHLNFEICELKQKVLILSSNSEARKELIKQQVRDDLSNSMKSVGHLRSENKVLFEKNAFLQNKILELEKQLMKKFNPK